MEPDGAADRSTRGTRGRKRRRDDGGVQGTDATAAATDAGGDADVDTSLQALKDKIAELEDRDVTTREWAVFMEVLYLITNDKYRGRWVPSTEIKGAIYSAHARLSWIDVPVEAIHGVLAGEKRARGLFDTELGVVVGGDPDPTFRLCVRKFRLRRLDDRPYVYVIHAGRIAEGRDGHDAVMEDWHEVAQLDQSDEGDVKRTKRMRSAFALSAETRSIETQTETAQAGTDMGTQTIGSDGEGEMSSDPGSGDAGDASATGEGDFRSQDRARNDGEQQQAAAARTDAGRTEISPVPQHRPPVPAVRQQQDLLLAQQQLMAQPQPPLQLQHQFYQPWQAQPPPNLQLAPPQRPLIVPCSGLLRKDHECWDEITKRSIRQAINCSAPLENLSEVAQDTACGYFGNTVDSLILHKVQMQERSLQPLLAGAKYTFRSPQCPIRAPFGELTNGTCPHCTGSRDRLNKALHELKRSVQTHAKPAHANTRIDYIANDPSWSKDNIVALRRQIREQQIEIRMPTSKNTIGGSTRNGHLHRPYHKFKGTTSHIQTRSNYSAQQQYR